MDGHGPYWPTSKNQKPKSKDNKPVGKVLRKPAASPKPIVQNFIIMRILVVAFLPILAIASSEDAFEVTKLNKDNYDNLTEGKTVFIKQVLEP